MPDDEDDVELSEGMTVVNEEGEELGTLGALLVEEDADEAEFLVLNDGRAERLVPFDAVLGVGDGNLVLDVPKPNVARFPALREGADPTEADMDLAYEVYEEGAGASDDDEDDVD